MNGVPVARRISAPGKLAGIQHGFGPGPLLASARYMRSLYDPYSTSGVFSCTRRRTVSLSVLLPALRGTAN